MNRLYRPGQPTVWDHFDAVMGRLTDNDVDAADAYLAEVLAEEGRAVYEDICSKIARYTGAPRP